MVSEDKQRITRRAYARIGLLGNPSDGFNGKTISISVENFYAEVTLTPSSQIRFLPHPEHDPQEFDSLVALATRVKTHGYYGGIRLLQALCYKFHEHCTNLQIALPAKPFTLKYETNIPKQAGLSGSSAIICAALKCLIEFYGVESEMVKADLPSLILSAESELAITAGLQDRVIQVYEGAVFMDFSKEIMEEKGRGEYTELDPGLIPQLYMIFCENPGDSGKVHNTVKQRWLAGDPVVRQGMEDVAALAVKGRKALEACDMGAFATCLDNNFALRRKMYGDEALGALNIRMVTIAQDVGAAAKFTGSGGASVVFLREQTQLQPLQEACDKEGFTLLPVTIHATSC
ncbi:hypothetical protein CYMTET_55309 [Cymbomonas tetramitiformis]|uniref:GHMP kinase N-terminal domain-containing protein n=1 Tax=Cymbomonas tetramitiformis TaxID=36881 RepID=A0AAE0BEE1_9CHLO|nr:hypothetical protein CYMTET_55309 [Cymbomonas tetramitiformis]